MKSQVWLTVDVVDGVVVVRQNGRLLLEIEPGVALLLADDLHVVAEPLMVRQEAAA